MEWNQKSCDGCRQSQFTRDGECTTRTMTKENTGSEFLRKKQRKVTCKPSATIAANTPIATVKKTEVAVLLEASRATWEQLQEWHNKSCSFKNSAKCKKIQNQLKAVVVFSKPCYKEKLTYWARIMLLKFNEKPWFPKTSAWQCNSEALLEFSSGWLRSRHHSVDKPSILWKTGV